MEVICQGLPAFWINGWLAAVGATALDPRIRLHWTTSDHLAVLSAADCDPVEALVESWPDCALLETLPIAETWQGAGVLQRKVRVDSFQERVRAARRRGHAHLWTLSSTMTDLSLDKNGEVAHAPFDPSGPGTIKWLHHRLLRVHAHVREPSAQRIRASLAGEAPRVQDNGLGFDPARIGSQADKTDAYTDPVVEVMAFFGLSLLPMRGRGVDGSLASKTDTDGGRQRGWQKPTGSRGALCFHWPTWDQPLNVDGIDALLDLWNPHKKRRWSSLGVHAAWRSVRYKALSTSDPTKAYGSERF